MQQCPEQTQYIRNKLEEKKRSISKAALHVRFSRFTSRLYRSQHKFYYFPKSCCTHLFLNCRDSIENLKFADALQWFL